MPRREPVSGLIERTAFEHRAEGREGRRDLESGCEGQRTSGEALRRECAWHTSPLSMKNLWAGAEGRPCVPGPSS